MSELKTYGLIGKDLRHSFSEKYFTTKFKKASITGAVYQNFPLDSINEFPKLVKEIRPLGLNVTIPYKEEIIPFLDDLSSEAQAVGAVNCIQFQDGKLHGHNTDVIGFEKSLKPLLNDAHSDAIILGTGGAAKAVVHILKKIGIRSQFVSTQANPDYLTYSEAEKQLASFPLIINTTPVGTFPNTEDSPLRSLKGVGEKHLVYDLIYNPALTCLLSQAKQLGAHTKNGLEMLEIQAEESWKIWNS